MARLRLTVLLKGKAHSRGTRFASRRDTPGHPRPVFSRLSCLSSPASSPAKAGCRVAERRQAGGKAAPATQAPARDEPFPRPRRVPRPPRVQTAPRGLSPAAAGRSPSCPQVENVVHHTALTRAHTCTHAHTPRSAQVHIPTGSISGAGSCPSSGCTENRRYARSPEKSHVVSRLIGQRVKTGACKTHLSQVFAVSTFVA